MDHPNGMDGLNSGVEPNWFVALPLPPAARWEQAARAAPAGLRRLNPADLHLTLAFLGPCGEERAQEAWRALEPLRSRPLMIRAGGWRALGPPSRPSAYGLTLAEGHRELVDLLQRHRPAALAAVALEAAGQTPPGNSPPPGESRPSPPGDSPLPHVTLLRPRRREAAHWRQPMAHWMARAPLPADPALLDALALYTWSEDRSRRLFRVVCHRSLA